MTSMRRNPSWFLYLEVRIPSFDGLPAIGIMRESVIDTAAGMVMQFDGTSMTIYAHMDFART